MIGFLRLVLTVPAFLVAPFSNVQTRSYSTLSPLKVLHIRCSIIIKNDTVHSKLQEIRTLTPPRLYRCNKRPPSRCN